MGLIRDRLAEVRFNAQEWLHNDDDEGYTTPSGVRVTRESALGLTTVWRCVDLISHAVSLAPTDVIVKVGDRSFPEFTKPGWLSAPVPSDPNYTGGDYFGEVALALLLDGNYFTLVTPDVFEPAQLTVLDPSRVVVKPGPRYDIKDEKGHVTATVGPMQMLHGWWLRLPGEPRGISPLEALRRGIGTAIAAEDFGGRFFGQGAALSFGVEVPGPLTPEQKTELRESLKRNHQGLSKSHAIGVLTSGAKFVGGLAPTPEQAQMLATRKFSVEDLCRPYGVPPGMAGSQEPGASSYASALVYREQFRDDAVLKFTTKIERGHARLLSVPDRLAGTGATVQMRFNLDWIARTNLLERYQAHSEGVRGGFITPNEARAKEDKPGIGPAGDRLYMQSQMVPIDMLGQEPAAAPAAQRFEPIVITMPEHRSAAPTEIHAHMPETRVEVPVHVHVPEQAAPVVNVPETPAPVVNVTAPVVNVAAPEVRAEVNVPQQAAPTVTVTTPDTMRIASMPARLTRRTVTKRDAKGAIVETTDIEEDMP